MGVYLGPSDHQSMARRFVDGRSGEAIFQSKMALMCDRFYAQKLFSSLQLARLCGVLTTSWQLQWAIASLVQAAAEEQRWKWGNCAQLQN